MIWLASLVVLPLPGPPTSRALEPMMWNTGFRRWKSAWEPPHMMAKVPAMAPVSPPETGASTKPTPSLASPSWQARLSPGVTLDMSHTSLPGVRAEARPPSPKSTCLEILPLGRIIRITSQVRAMSA